MAAKSFEWQTVNRKISELTEWDKNPRVLLPEELQKLKESITEFGLAEFLVINTDNVIIGGHGRLAVLKEMGVKKVNCIVPDRKLTPKEFKRLNVRLNKNIAGIWNKDSLQELFTKDELQELGFAEFEFADWNEGKDEVDKIAEENSAIRAKITINCPQHLEDEIRSQIQSIIDDNQYDAEIE